MKTTPQAAAATAMVLAALVLAGCQSGGSGAAAAAPTSPASVTHSGPATAAGPVAPAASPAGAAAGPPRCHTAGLAVTLGAPQGPASGQQTMRVTFTDTSAAACSLYGFPGVNLVAGRIQWALERQSRPAGGPPQFAARRSE